MWYFHTSASKKKKGNPAISDNIKESEELGLYIKQNKLVTEG
jgi:hypothetical protein